ncbi:DUF2339 domain-containing protein [Solirubrobacter pauli]|uniref:DUF2339 domain-containing protein n=1 Tax=Solirubrobacter pauli TaxID=166793 RepID=UPI001476BA7A|nr:DUF2339 domain-containing protein [Solirubrobacter pauli]
MRPGSRDPGHHGEGAHSTTAKPKRDLEDVLGGSVLAWVGGVAVLAGLAFLLTIAISRGWLGEGARTLLAGALSTALLAVGVRLRERDDRTEAALAATAVGIAGLFGTLMMAGAVYSLIPLALAQAAAFAVGAVATTLAIRWDAQPIGWLGLLGALLAPAVLGALDDGGIAFLAIAYAASVRVLVWRRWTALAWAVFATVTVEWVAWLALDTPGDGVAHFVLATFGALTAALAYGLDSQRAKPNPSALALITLNSVLMLGFAVDDAATLAAVAAAHVLVGLAATQIPRISRPIALITIAAGVVIADFAVAAQFDGLVVTVLWGAGAVVFAALLGARRMPDAVEPFVKDFGIAIDEDWRPRVPGVARLLGRPHEEDWTLAVVGLVGQLLIAVGHVLAVEAPLERLAGPSVGATGLVAVAAIGLVAFVCARLSWRALDLLALTAVAGFTGLAAEGLPVTLALAAEGALLGLAAARGAAVRGPADQWASLAFVALAAVHALAVVVPPDALVNGLGPDPLEPTLALAAVTAALGVTLLGRKAAPFALLYLASGLVVTVGGPEHGGQALLSVLWALCGVGAVVYGLVKDVRPVRLVALALLAVTAVKVFGYDMASLDNLARVASFIVFGILLLLGAFAWQRVRPRALT